MRNQFYKNYYEDLIYDLVEKSDPKNLEKIKRRCLKRRAQYLIEEGISDDSQISHQSINKLQPDRAFSEMSKGNSTDESEQGELKEKKADQEKLDKLIELKKSGQKIDISHLPQSFQSSMKMIQKQYKEDQYRKILLEEGNQQKYGQFTNKSGKGNTSDGGKDESNALNNGKNSVNGGKIAGNQKKSIDKANQDSANKKIGSSTSLQHQQNLLNQSDRDSQEVDNPPNTKQHYQSHQQSQYRLESTPDWIEYYRKQEKERYQYPTRPWTFTLQNGQKVVVGPVAKKISVSLASKPRDHPLLRSDRLPYITILCLVKDAASKLPSGEGSRLDICELLKESQYVSDDLPIDKISGIVSGALDRLHYLDDPCVKYDLERKLWMYIHKDRTEDYPDWQDGDENIKLESTKTKKKKKLNMFMGEGVKNEQNNQFISIPKNSLFN